MQFVTLLALLSLVAFVAASPVPEQDTDEERENWPETGELKQDLTFDKEERGVEIFANGTLKNSTKAEEDKIRRLMQEQGGQEQWRKTNEHWWEEDKEEERSKRDSTDTDSDSVPYCALAKLANGCTAMFIGPNYALTAGRCVYTWRLRTDQGLYRGQNCNTSGVHMDIEQIWSTIGYTQQSWQEYDYALIKTPDSQQSPCWSAFGYRNTWTNQEFDLIGYSAIEVDESEDENDAQSVCTYSPVFKTTCLFSDVLYNDLTLEYQCDTWGATGAPLLSGVPEDGAKQYTVVYGVNAYTNMDWNSGTMLTQQRFYQIVEWMRESGYDPLS